jgi:head-tail adaptor
VNPGKLRHVAAYQTPTPAPDQLGQELLTWTTVCSVRCEVRSPNGRESLQAQRFLRVADHVVTHRHAGFIPDPAGRYLLEDGRTLEIVSSGDPDNRGREVVSLCIQTRQNA